MLGPNHHPSTHPPLAAALTDHITHNEPNPTPNHHRIDLPLYKNKRDLKDRLSLAIQMESSGFDIE